MNKTNQFCKCGKPLVFRGWSNRYERNSKWQEALASCECGEKWQLRYFNGHPTTEPYQVSRKSMKTKSCSARTSKERFAAIVALWGSFQDFVDNVNVLPCNTMQSKR
jgi:hypothetical protein